MKFSVFLTAFILLQLSTNIHGGCRIYGRKQLDCTEFNENFLTYSNEYENLTYVSLSRDFTEIGFDSRFTKLLRVDLYSESLVKFNMDNLNNLTSLTHLSVTPFRKIGLNVVVKINNCKHLEFIHLTRLQYLPGSFTSFVNLKTIKLYEYEGDYLILVHYQTA